MYVNQLIDKISQIVKAKKREGDRVWAAATPGPLAVPDVPLTSQPCADGHDTTDGHHAPLR